jgi:hypothetical protein
VLFLPDESSLVLIYVLSFLSPHYQTQTKTSSAGVLIFAATQPRKNPAMIGEVAPTPHIALQLLMETALVWKVQRGVEWVSSVLYSFRMKVPLY